MSDHTYSVINSNGGHTHIQPIIKYFIKLGMHRRIVESKRIESPAGHNCSCILNLLQSRLQLEHDCDYQDTKRNCCVVC